WVSGRRRRHATATPPHLRCDVPGPRRSVRWHRRRPATARPGPPAGVPCDQEAPVDYEKPVNDRDPRYTDPADQVVDTTDSRLDHSNGTLPENQEHGNEAVGAGAGALGGAAVGMAVGGPVGAVVGGGIGAVAGAGAGAADEAGEEARGG